MPKKIKPQATPVDVRLSGDNLVCLAIISCLQDFLNVSDVSRPYPNRDGNSVRYYLKISPQPTDKKGSKL